MHGFLSKGDFPINVYNHVGRMSEANYWKYHESLAWPVLARVAKELTDKLFSQHTVLVYSVFVMSGSL